MFTLFFILSWVAILTSIASRRASQKSKLLLPGQVDQDFREAQTKQDHAALVRYYKLALEKAPSEQDAQLIRINLAYSLSALSDYRQAISELDKISLKMLSPTQIILWLNNRAYNLSKLDLADEALDHLKDAEELLLTHHDLSQDHALIACIHSTRGMVLLQKGELDRAEKSIELALRFETNDATTDFDSVKVPMEGDPGRTAERYFLLSEISKKRGDNIERMNRLQKAARFPFTEYGQKAAHLLRQEGREAENVIQTPKHWKVVSIEEQE